MILYYGINFSGPSDSESLPIHHGNKDLKIQIQAQATVILQGSRNPLLQYRQEQACLSLELATLTGLHCECFGGQDGYGLVQCRATTDHVSFPLQGVGPLCRLIVCKHNVLLF